MQCPKSSKKTKKGNAAEKNRHHIDKTPSQLVTCYIPTNNKNNNNFPPLKTHNSM